MNSSQIELLESLMLKDRTDKQKNRENNKRWYREQNGKQKLQAKYMNSEKRINKTVDKLLGDEMVIIELFKRLDDKTIERYMSTA